MIRTIFPLLTFIFFLFSGCNVNPTAEERIRKLEKVKKIDKLVKIAINDPNERVASATLSRVHEFERPSALPNFLGKVNQVCDDRDRLLLLNSKGIEIIEMRDSRPERSYRILLDHYQELQDPEFVTDLLAHISEERISFLGEIAAKSGNDLLVRLVVERVSVWEKVLLANTMPDLGKAIISNLTDELLLYHVAAERHGKRDDEGRWKKPVLENRILAASKIESLELVKLLAVQCAYEDESEFIRKWISSIRDERVLTEIISSYGTDPETGEPQKRLIERPHVFLIDAMKRIGSGDLLGQVAVRSAFNECRKKAVDRMIEIGYSEEAVKSMISSAENLKRTAHIAQIVQLVVLGSTHGIPVKEKPYSERLDEIGGPDFFPDYGSKDRQERWREKRLRSRQRALLQFLELVSLDPAVIRQEASSGLYDKNTKDGFSIIEKAMLHTEKSGIKDFSSESRDRTIISDFVLHTIDLQRAVDHPALVAKNGKITMNASIAKVSKGYSPAGLGDAWRSLVGHKVSFSFQSRAKAFSKEWFPEFPNSYSFNLISGAGAGYIKSGFDPRPIITTFAETLSDDEKVSWMSALAEDYRRIVLSLIRNSEALGRLDVDGDGAVDTLDLVLLQRESNKTGKFLSE